jgi:hypothetical protein
MDYTAPSWGQVVATLVLLFTAHNTMVLTGHPVMYAVALVAFGAAGGVLVLQAYGTYRAWSGVRSGLGE